MENYIHVKIFILWTLVISTLANERAKNLSRTPNHAQMHSLSLWAEPTKDEIDVYALAMEQFGCHKFCRFVTCGNGD
jgi:hypothetical protein